MIGIKQASPLGLVVNELITNSLKYAFPEKQMGEIIISLWKTENEIKLEYADNGIGIPDEIDCYNTKGMGLQLVKMLVERQLEGTLDMKTKNGTTFIIKFNINEA